MNQESLFKSYVKIKPKNVLGKGSYLKEDGVFTRQMNDWLIKQSGYYKAILPEKDTLERIEDLPWDMQSEEAHKTLPRAKFTL